MSAPVRNTKAREIFAAIDLIINKAIEDSIQVIKANTNTKVAVRVSEMYTRRKFYNAADEFTNIVEDPPKLKEEK